MISKKFTVAKHEDYGTLGLKMAGMWWAEPFPGMAAAHDILEHFPSDDGSMEAEYMALGASLLVRDGSSYFHHKGSFQTDPAVHLGSEIISQFHYAVQRGGMLMRAPGRTTTIDGSAEDYIQQTAVESRRVLLVEFSDDREEQAREFVSAEQLRRMVGWMRKGYRRAVKRYSGIPAWRLLSTFMEIEKRADEFLQHAYEGQELIIRCQPAFGDVELIETEEAY